MPPPPIGARALVVAMALAKLLFLFALVVTYRRDWVERQIGRHLRALRLALRALVPRRVDADEAWSSAEFGASDRPPPRGSVHAARVADRMLTDRGRDILCGARASSRTPDDLGAPSAARVAAKLESQWETRARRRRAPAFSADPKTLLDVVTERRRRSARAAERHEEVRARALAARARRHLRGEPPPRQRRGRRGAQDPETVAAVSETRDPSEVDFAGVGGMFVEVRA